MKITVLSDNITFTDKQFFGEPGLSYWVEVEGQSILFDLGFSDVYLRNAKKLKIDLLKTKTIVLSHGHNDHTQGLKYFPKYINKITLISHPYCLLPKYSDGEYSGSPISYKQATKRFNYITSTEPYFITPNIAYLGEIKEKYSFEKRRQTGYIVRNNQKEPDFLIDDSALAIKTKKGVVIITGCSHSGICNIVAQAKKIFEGEKIYSVIGGFHLRGEYKEKVEETAITLKKEVNGIVYPAHCVDFSAKCYLASRLKTEQVFVSKIINFD